MNEWLDPSLAEQDPGFDRRRSLLIERARRASRLQRDLRSRPSKKDRARYWQPRRVRKDLTTEQFSPADTEIAAKHTDLCTEADKAQCRKWGDPPGTWTSLNYLTLLKCCRVSRLRGTQHIVQWRAYVLKAMWTVATNERAKEQNRTPWLLTSHDLESLHSEDWVARHEDREEVARLLKGPFTPEEIEFIQRWGRGFSIEEIARDTGRPRTTISRALTKFRFFGKDNQQ